MSDKAREPELSYPAVRNGLDFLRSVVEHLDGPEPDSRAVKFAVLHLQAATEILLKAALASIDWTLVFQNPDEADEAAYQAGDFVSIKHGRAVALLKDHEVTITGGEKRQIEKLAGDRNKIAHFGGTLSAAAVEERAGKVLEFLLRFIDDHLPYDLGGADAEDMAVVRESVPRIRSYVTARMAKLQPELEALKASTLQCPNCEQWALVVDGGFHCRLCPDDQQAWEPYRFALEYAVGVLGHSWRDYRKTGAGETCPNCGRHTLCGEVYFADAPEKRRQFCPSCSMTFDGLDNCIRCTLPFQPRAEDDLACDNCWADVLASD